MRRAHVWMGLTTWRGTEQHSSRLQGTRPPKTLETPNSYCVAPGTFRNCPQDTFSYWVGYWRVPNADYTPLRDKELRETVSWTGVPPEDYLDLPVFFLPLRALLRALAGAGGPNLHRRRAT